MKIVVEKVAEGVRLTVTADPSKKPVVFVIRPGELQMIETVIRTAMRADSFRFEYQQ